MHAYTATVPAAQAGAPDSDCDHGSSSSPPPPPPPPSTPSPWPVLLLDSGTSFHMVGDRRLLCKLRDAPAGMRVRVVGVNTLRVTKISEIDIGGFRIPGVFLVPGFQSNLISVRQLSRIGICTWFDGDGRAMLYAGPELVGVAVVDQDYDGFYALQFLRIPAVWCGAGSSARTPWLKQPAEHCFTWSQFLPLRVDTRKRLRLRSHMRKQLWLRRSHISSSPKLLLDSGSVSHMVSDPRFLSNLRDAPAGLRMWAADGNTMPVTKIGDIHIQGLTISDVCLVPGLKLFDGVISVHRLARESGICTWIEGDRAKLYAGAKLVGVAVAPRENLAGLYILQSLKIAAA